MQLDSISNPQVKNVFESYPRDIQPKMLALRSIIIATATELKLDLEETLKWGEPSYLCNQGSTLRIDWKAKNAEFIGLYFKCTSKLVPSFKQVFGDLFTYENNRAILLPLTEPFKVDILKKCVAAAFNYHKIKHQENLGLWLDE
ncbi:MAG: DUF1801 domain-containing protein [Luteibaculum sp.]